MSETTTNLINDSTTRILDTWVSIAGRPASAHIGLQVFTSDKEPGYTALYGNVGEAASLLLLFPGSIAEVNEQRVERLFVQCFPGAAGASPSLIRPRLALRLSQIVHGQEKPKLAELVERECSVAVFGGDDQGYVAMYIDYTDETALGFVFADAGAALKAGLLYAKHRYYAPERDMHDYWPVKTDTPTEEAALYAAQDAREEAHQVAFNEELAALAATVKPFVPADVAGNEDTCLHISATLNGDNEYREVQITCWRDEDGKSAVEVRQ